MNVKHPFKGNHILDEMSMPIESYDKKIVFLKEFSTWLNKWEKLSSLKADKKRELGIPSKGGALSKDTFFALEFTTNSIIEIVNYIYESVAPNYLLLGKFQTDNLEARFGQYRQMSGGNYNISCLQVLESEKKLKILNFLSLRSEMGEFQLKNLDFSEHEKDTDDYEIPEHFYDVFNSFDDDEIKSETMSVLVYIAGYVAHKVCLKLKCTLCVTLLVKQKILEIECPKEEVFQYLKLR